MRWICCHARRDKIKNKDIWDKVGVVSIENKMRKMRLTWFWHVQRRCRDALVWRFGRLAMDGFKRCWLWIISREVGNGWFQERLRKGKEAFVKGY